MSSKDKRIKKEIIQSPVNLAENEILSTVKVTDDNFEIPLLSRKHAFHFWVLVSFSALLKLVVGLNRQGVGGKITCRLMNA